PTVVAVYERGLGVGDYLVGPRGLDDHLANPAAATLLVQTEPSSTPDVQAALTERALVGQDPATYAEGAADSGAAERTLSTILLLALLAFVFLAAANALVMVTARRGSEFRLYGRTGATRAQLLRMTIIEAALTGALAWIIGTMAALPAAIAVGLGMLGPVLPPVDFTTYLLLSGIAILLPLLTVVPTTFTLVRNQNSLSRPANAM
ncbi:MAG: FtsX-like permease family protein, partial [Ornithinimicrobium sp.]